LKNNCAYLCPAVPKHVRTIVTGPLTGEAESKSTERMQQIGNELRDLNTELVSLQTRALHRVEQIENEFDGVVLQDDVKTMFLTMQRLITRVLRLMGTQRLLVQFPFTAASLRYLFALGRRFRFERFGIRATIHAYPDLLINIRALVIVCAVHAANCTLRPC
jgi:hypothetical protein